MRLPSLPWSVAGGGPLLVGLVFLAARAAARLILAPHGNSAEWYG